MAALHMVWNLSTIPPKYLSSSLLRKQLCMVESIRRRHGTLSRLPLPTSISSFCSTAIVTRFPASRMQFCQHIKRHLVDAAYGSRKTQHRSSSTNGGPSKPTEAKTTTSDPTQIDSLNNGSRLDTKDGSMTLWKKFLAPKPMPERYSASWYREIVLICTVFAITGSTTMLIVRPAVSEGLGIKGSFIDGPWSYRICSIVIMTPIYATLLVGIGTIFGRHAYFRHFSVKIFSRFGIPPELMDPTYQATKQSFKKW